MAIYLVRHAETVSNATRVVQLPDAPLSPAGLEQADRLARRLADQGIARILSSDLRRAAATAAALHATTGAPVDFDPRLQERNYGDVRGVPYVALEVDIFAPDYTPPGGETWAAFHARIDAAWTHVLDVTARTAGHVAVVTHGLVCQAVLERHLDTPAGGAPPAWGNTALTVIDGTPPRHVRLLACTSHLDGARVGGRGPGSA